MKVIVFGTGMVGSAFEGVKRFSREEVDVTCHKLLERVVKKEKPDCIINCASVTDIYRCEENPAEAYRVNVGGVINLGGISRKLCIKLIQFSTMFAGDSNVYTKTKRVAEEILPQLTRDYAIVQLPWLFSRRKDCKFTNTVVECLRKGKKVPIYSDEVGSPTYTGDVAKYVLSNFDKISGKVIIGNSGSATREEWASEIASILKIKLAGFDEIKRSVQMMRDSRIECADSSKVLFRNWKRALRECLL